MAGVVSVLQIAASPPPFRPIDVVRVRGRKHSMEIVSHEYRQLASVSELASARALSPYFMRLSRLSRALFTLSVERSLQLN